MELSLKVMSGRNAGQIIRVPVSKFIIGRSEDCHLRPHSDLISRHHCAILVEDDIVAVRDFNSRNGTFVNGERVVGQTALKNGDQLSVGQLTFEVHAGHSTSAAKKPKVQSAADAAARIVTASKEKDDTDITQWLLEETTINGASDTRSSEAPTKQLAGSDLSALNEGAGEGSDISKTVAGTSDSKAGLGKKSGPGKLPAVPQLATKDSREAATEMLRKILRNR